MPRITIAVSVKKNLYSNPYLYEAQAQRAGERNQESKRNWRAAVT